jgi:hypothetical protein
MHDSAMEGVDGAQVTIVASCGSQLEVGSHVCFVKEHVAWRGPPEDNGVT